MYALGIQMEFKKKTLPFHRSRKPRMKGTMDYQNKNEDKGELDEN